MHTVELTAANVSDEREIERRKASVRSKVEHPFQVIKRRFGWTKTRYRGVKKNLHKAPGHDLPVEPGDARERGALARLAAHGGAGLTAGVGRIAPETALNPR